MVKFSFITALALLFLFPKTIFSVEVRDVPTVILERDEWWNARKFNDRPRFFNLKSDDGCPAELFYFDCNGCRCIRGNRAACTKMGCNVPQIPNYADGMECPAGKPFYFKCNDCDCHEDGKSATCTKKECPEPPQN